MFCPYCGKQNEENVAFCKYCGRSMVQKISQPPQPTQWPDQQTAKPKKLSSPRVRLSFTAIKAVVTVLLLAAVIIVVLMIYYPGLLPWNW